MTINHSKSQHIRFCLNNHPICSCHLPDLTSKTQIKILGVTFQTNCKFTIHSKTLIKALRRTLYILRDLKLNSFSRKLIDEVFEALILSRIRYCISVYAADPISITRIDAFLDSCFRHGYTSVRHSAPDILKHEDHRIATNILNNPFHPLHNILKKHKKRKTTRHNFTYTKPTTNTITFSRSFCNRVLPL